MSIDTNKKYAALIKTTEGNIVIDLDIKETPITVNNFVFLAKNNFYDNTIFHRVVKNFMIQGGDPAGDGTGGPGYTFDDEPITKDYKRGTIAMANRGPNTNGSQFFIMHQDYPLPKNYVIFGSVSNGLEVLDKIAKADVVTAQSGELSKPVNPVKILTIEINEY
ncbi:peptidylprolyl isomerase [Candidatus Woesebacteria bacterium]|nr:peptidylprolyl isomerase [Candidatus Woesebacteria bacterium]QQG47964.1 MAG: peptidylprolyl isomerase [Candidatus Woesebacteria bacterium]